MNLEAPISSIMTKDPITISPEDPMLTVDEIFKREKIHHLPVIDQGLLVGMLSKSDYLLFKRGFNGDTTDNRIDLFRLKTRKVKEVMTKGLAKMDPGDRIDIALDVFKKNLFHAILVTEQNHLRGIVTPMDIITYIIDEHES